MIDWDSLDLPDYEDPKETLQRLNDIHEKMLEQKGLTLRPQHNSPGFIPSPAQAREVAVMSCLGLEPKDIALVINVEEKLLKLYYSKELKVSHNLANALVARQALMMAMSGRFPDMTKFWLKTRAKWKETSALEVEDKSKDADRGSAKERVRQALALHDGVKPKLE